MLRRCALLGTAQSICVIVMQASKTSALQQRSFYSELPPSPFLKPIHVIRCVFISSCEQEPWRRQHVWRLARRLGCELGVPVSSPIVPLLVGTEQAAVDASMQLLRCGFHVPAIRPPTVPAGTSRLRVSLSAAHTDDDLRRLTSALRGCGLRFQPWKQLQGEAGSRGVQPADVEPGEVDPEGPCVDLISRL